MNLVLLQRSDFIALDRVRITGRRHEHVREVHRVSAGDELTVGVEGGRIGRGVVQQLDDESLEMTVVLERDPPAPLPLTLLLALPRPPVLNRVLLNAAAMGVKRIVLMNSWRVEKSYWQTPRLTPDNIREQLVLGLEQARDTTVPDVRLARRFRPFVEDELPDMLRGTTALVAHPEANSECPRHVSGAVTLAIGPEGGFIDNEIAMLAGVGFTPVTIGERILRVESAVPALIGRLF